jgi:hypothetical protein
MTDKVGDKVGWSEEKIDHEMMSVFKKIVVLIDDYKINAHPRLLSSTNSM